MANYTIDSLTYGSNKYTLTLPLGSCSTEAATAAKVITCPNFLVLDAGARIAIMFTYANTADNATLNVNNLGARAIRPAYQHQSQSCFLTWAPQSIVEFIYDGTYWNPITDANLLSLLEDGCFKPYCSTLADKATQLKTTRTISLTGLVTGSATFNGSANCTINTKASTYLDALMTQNYCIAMSERVANTVSSNPPFLVADMGGSACATANAFLKAKPGLSISTEWYSDGYLNTTTNSCEANFTITNNSPYTLTVYFYLQADWDDNSGQGVWVTGMSDRLAYELEAGEVLSSTTMVDCSITGTLYDDYPIVKIEALGYDMSSTL